MNKPRVLIAMHYLHLGGAETALIGLLHAWDYERADVDLFLYARRGELLSELPLEVNLLPELADYRAIESPVAEALRSGRLGVVYGRMRARQYYRKSRHRDAIFDLVGRHVTQFLPPMSTASYDLAISFIAPHHPVLYKVDARRKICWIHTDYSYLDIDTEAEHDTWGAYDNIISISPAVTEGFCSKFPGLRDRIIEVENVIPADLIRRRAEEYIPAEFNDNNFNILSVGRFSHQKNFDNVPDIMRRLIDITGRTDLHWHIIGYGADERLISDRIAKAGMESRVHLLGKRDNPYPYMAACDLYIQPSRYEGKSIAVREAQMLGRPVIITDYATARSQVDNGTDGLIVPLDNASCARAIADALSSPGLLTGLASATATRDYTLSHEVQKLYRLL